MRKIHYVFHLLFLILLIVLSVACTRQSVSELQELSKEGSDFLMAGEYEKADSVAQILLNKAEKEKDNEYTARAHYILGTYRYADDSVSRRRLRHLDKAVSLTPDTARSFLASIYNTKGLWNLRYLRYDSALVFLEKGLRLAHETDQERLAAGVETNLAEVYRFLEDTLGYHHIEKVYHWAKHANSKEIALHAAYQAAIHLSERTNDSTRLEYYLNELECSDTEFKEWVPGIRSRFYLNNGNIVKSAFELRRLPEDMFGYVFFERLRAEVLQAEHQYAASNESAIRALQLQAIVNQDDSWPSLHRLMAENYEKLGERQKALEHLNRYVIAHDSIEQEINRAQIKAYRVQYEVDIKEQELKLAKAEATNLRLALISGSLLILLVSGGLILYYRHRRKYYHTIVAQNREAIRRESELELLLDDYRKQIQRSGNHNDAGNEKETSSGNQTDQIISAEDVSDTSKARSAEIFKRICHEMDENHIWRDTNLTREGFAVIIKSNRTYLTKAITSETGLSYNQFINTRRVHEAVKVLNDGNKNVSLEQLAHDVGYISVSTFYTAFKAIMGMSPSSYRKIANSDEFANV